LYVNLFVESEAEMELGGNTVRVRQETRYPWEGAVKIVVEPEEPSSFAVHVRIPGWTREEPVPTDLYRFVTPSTEKVSLRVNDEPWPMETEKGFVRIQRDWAKGDTVELDLPMPIRRVESHPAVADAVGKVALQRGPIVYCAEWPDHEGYVSNLVLPDDAELTVARRDDLFDGVTVIRGRAVSLHEATPHLRDIALTAIPYYSWAYRGKGEMAVWLPRVEKGVRPLPKPTIASESRASASAGETLIGLNDRWDPVSSSDRSRPYLHWWPKTGTTEWVQYDFAGEEDVSRVEVYWYDDRGRGQCRVPASWKVLYRREGDWVPVSSEDSYGVTRDDYDRLRFQEVRTTGLRLEIQSQEDFAAGILEWKVQ
jgi:hypothetical protein